MIKEDFMSQITVLNKANVPMGPFTREQVADKLRSGEFAPSDLAFIEGLSQWTPLRDVLAKADGTGGVRTAICSSVNVGPSGLFLRCDHATAGTFGLRRVLASLRGHLH